MTGQTLAFALITFLHDLFTAVWIGGLVVIGITVLPAAQALFGRGPETRKLMASIQHRQSTLVYVSIAGLLLTGLLQARQNPAFEGLFSFANPYSTAMGVKHLLVIAMIAVALYRSLVPGRRQGPPTPAQERLNARLLLVNIGLGVAVLLASGFVAALGVA